MLHLRVHLDVLAATEGGLFWGEVVVAALCGGAVDAVAEGVVDCVVFAREPSLSDVLAEGGAAEDGELSVGEHDDEVTGAGGLVCLIGGFYCVGVVVGSFLLAVGYADFPENRNFEEEIFERHNCFVNGLSKTGIRSGVKAVRR